MKNKYGGTASVFTVETHKRILWDLVNRYLSGKDSSHTVEWLEQSILHEFDRVYGLPNL